MDVARAELAADLHDKHCALVAGNFGLALLGSQVGIHILELLRGDERYLIGQELADEIIFLGDIGLRVAQAPVNRADGSLEGIDVALLGSYYLLPIPLINKDGVEIIRILVAAYGIHVRIETLAGLEAVIFEGAALPLRKRLDDFNIAVHVFYIERNGALDAVQCIVESGIRAHKKRRGDAGKIELDSEIPLEEILDLFDSHLSLSDIEQGLISCRKIA